MMCVGYSFFPVKIPQRWRYFALYPWMKSTRYVQNFPNSSSLWQFMNHVACSSNLGGKSILLLLKRTWGIGAGRGGCPCPANQSWHSSCLAVQWSLCPVSNTLGPVIILHVIYCRWWCQVLGPNWISAPRPEVRLTCVLFSSLPRFQLRFQVAISVFPETGLHQAAHL